MRNREASFVYILLSGVMSLSYSMLLTVELVYLIKAVGFDPLQLVFIGTIRQSVSFVFQLPTGVLADIYSRRWAVILGLLLIGCGYLIEGAIPIVAIVFAAQVLTGLGVTLMEGADAAWISDEVGAERIGPIFLRAGQIGSLASLVGIAISALLVNIRLNLPLVLGGSLFIALSILLVFLMHEHAFVPAPRENRNTFQQVRYTLRVGARLIPVQPVLLAILGVAMLSGAFSAGFDQLWNYHLLHNFTFPPIGGLTSVTWFSVIEVCIVITNFCGISLVNWLVDTNNRQAVVFAQFIINSIAVASVVWLALAGQFVFALFGFFLFTTVRGPSLTLEQVWMNSYLHSNVRATLFSLRGQVSAIAQIVGGPLLGLIATGINSRVAMVVAGIVLAPTLVLYLWSLRTDKTMTIPTKETNEM